MQLSVGRLRSELFPTRKRGQQPSPAGGPRAQQHGLWSGGYNAMNTFTDRRHAGQLLGEHLAQRLAGDTSPKLVLGLVRGGMPVAEPVAAALGAAVDAFVVRKIGAPGQPEFGIGAIAEGGGQALISQHAARAVSATPAQLEATIAAESRELARRVQAYRGGRSCAPVAGKTVVLVDDGLATGITARAALQALRGLGAARLLLAVPVGAASSVAELQASGLADEVVCLSKPKHFRAVGLWYDDFTQTSDEEVMAILARQPHHTAATPAAAAAAPAGPHASPGPQQQQERSPDSPRGPATPAAAAAAAAAATAATPVQHSRGMAPTAGRDVSITSARLPQCLALQGTLTVPPGACGLVVFAHGSGSSRHSPRNKQVASCLNEAGIATLLMDLLSPQEADDRAKVFDIGLLASRLQMAVEWLEADDATLPADFPVGLFGASTGGGAALWASAYLGSRVAAVVVRGGRPDLAAEKLPAVTAPTLLLVGGEDTHVASLNRLALQGLGSSADSRLLVVPDAGHLFEGPGQLERVAAEAAHWFVSHMVPPAVEQEQQQQL